MTGDVVGLFFSWFLIGAIFLMGVAAIGIWIIGKIRPGIEGKRNVIYLAVLILNLGLTIASIIQYQNSKPLLTTGNKADTSNSDKKIDLELFGKPDRIIGGWIEEGTDYPERKAHYEFIESGEFQYNIGKGLCVIAEDQETEGKELGYQGKWEVKNNVLVLSTLSKTVLKNGARAIPKEDCGTKDQRINAVIEEIKLPEIREIVFTRGECTNSGYANGCEMYTDKGDRYVQVHFSPETVEYAKVEAKQPLIIGNYKIELPKGWGWEKMVEGVMAEGPGTYCSNPNNLAKNFETNGLEKCGYAVIKDLSENCSDCNSIVVMDTDKVTMGGGGYITTVEEVRKLGPNNMKADFIVSWRGNPPEKENDKPTIQIDENGKPFLYYVNGCLKQGLCINYNEGSWRPWSYEKIRDFINDLVIGEN